MAGDAEQTSDLGPEALRLDRAFEHQGLQAAVRDDIWRSSRSIAGHGPLAADGVASATGVAIGYVQSGKTTNFTALIGHAADTGYRVVIALLGSTNLLLEQNERRLLSALGLEQRWDYRWVHFSNPTPSSLSPSEFAHYLARGRLVLITLLKHHGRIAEARRVVEGVAVGAVATLVVDDEADQVSLNSRVKEGAESATYRAIKGLRSGLGPHLYVQYTATPYAPLLLEVEDFLSPDFVELLSSGPGYVGGREIFVDHRAIVVREVEDAPGPTETPTRLPSSLRAALGDFVVGAAMLLATDPAFAPVSMLVHPTGRVEPQRRYEFLLSRLLRAWRRELAAPVTTNGYDFEAVRRELVSLGCADVSDADFRAALRRVLDEATIWRVNSADDANARVRWNIAPVHILIGGNKLDRGFTVEGLTVSWLGRPSSPQVDTMIQRARAYGYRGRYLPYCRVYGSRTTVAALASGVLTELDMRAHLRTWVDEGRPVKEWASEVGLIIGTGLRPTRQQVIARLAEFRPGWHLLTRPLDDLTATAANMALLDEIGLVTASIRQYGRLSHRTLEGVSASVVRGLFIDRWLVDRAPGWDLNGLGAWLRRLDAAGSTLTVAFMTAEEGRARLRSWDEQTGFEQLMQGRDRVTSAAAYPGDRDILPGHPQVQVHLVRPRGSGHVDMLALAIYVPEMQTIVTRGAKSA